jgi:hypothetical protein
VTTSNTNDDNTVNKCVEALFIPVLLQSPIIIYEKWVSDNIHNQYRSAAREIRKQLWTQAHLVDRLKAPNPQELSRDIFRNLGSLFGNSFMIFARILSIKALKPDFGVPEILFRYNKDISNLGKGFVLGDRRVPRFVQFISVILDFFTGRFESDQADCSGGAFKEMTE